MCSTPGLGLFCRESYNDPAELYAGLKRLGMTLVTITDHDSIDGAEALRHHPDFFVSEEATLKLPTGTEMHLGIYGITETDHLEIQRRRNDFVSLMMYLTERKLLFSANHVFSGLTGRRQMEDFDWIASYIPAMETRNGQMWHKANDAAAQMARRLGKVEIAGSDSHTIAGAGRTYTEVPRARNAEEFLAGLRAQRATIHGEHGSWTKLTADVYRIIGSLFCEKPWIFPILPISALVPAVIAGHWMNEIRFGKKWSAMIEDEKKSSRMIWDLESNLERSESLA